MNKHIYFVLIGRASLLSGVHKAGFSKGRFSNLCVIIMFVLLPPHSLYPLCELPILAS